MTMAVTWLEGEIEVQPVVDALFLSFHLLCIRNKENPWMCRKWILIFIALTLTLATTAVMGANVTDQVETNDG